MDATTPEPEPELQRKPREKLIDLVPEGDGPCILEDVGSLGAACRRPLTHTGLRHFVLQQFQREVARCGVPRGARICVALPSGPESAVALFAFSSWGCYAPLPFGHTATELAAELADLQPSALIALAGSVDLVNAARLGIRTIALLPDKVTTGIFELRACCSGMDLSNCFEHPIPDSAVHDVAMLLQTSGTTKRPKTVALTHTGLGWGARRVAETLRLTGSDVCVNPMPLYHLHGIAVNLLASVIAGAAVVCPLDPVTGQRLLRCLREHRATWYSATPTHHLALLQAAQAEQPDVDLPRLTVPGLTRLRFIRNCSAALTAPLARELQTAFSTTVIPSYAMTECLPIASHVLPSEDSVSKWGDHDMREVDDRLGSVGMPAGAEIIVMSVLEEQVEQREGEGAAQRAVDTAVVAVGDVGEVAVRGPCLMPGYVTEQASSSDGSDSACRWAFTGLTAAGWLRTGDLGYLDDAGYLHLTGRIKEIINRGGEVLSPFVIEDALSAHPSVGACVAFAIPHGELGETVGLMAVISAGQRPVSLEALRTFALSQGKLRVQALPAVLVWSTPKSGFSKGRTGKPLRIGLAARLGLEDNLDTGGSNSRDNGDGDSGCNCWIARKRYHQGNEEGWQLEPWRDDQHEDVCVAPVSDLNASAKVALHNYATTASSTKQENEHAVRIVTESVRRLAVAAIGLTPGVAADDIITADGVLLDRGLDSMSATGFVDDVFALYVSPLVAAATDSRTANLSASPSATSSSASVPSVHETPWTTEILQTHSTPRKIAVALCDLAATVCRESVGTEKCSSPSVVRVGTEVDESQRKRAVAKSAARRAAKRAPRLSKDERRAAFAAQSSDKWVGGTATTKTTESATLVENASVASSGLHHAKHGDLASLRVLIEGGRGWDASAVRDRHGLTALQWAAGGGHLEVVEYLLEGGRGGDVDARSKDGRTALMWSCRNGALAVAQRLVYAGADPHAVSKKGVSCLHWAVWGQQPELAEWLLGPPNSLDLEGCSDAGCNAAIWAASSGGLDIAQWLHEQGANFLALNHWGHGVVNKAAWRGHLDLLRWMFREIPGTLDQLFLRDYAGFVPVELAAQAGHDGTARFLTETMEKHPQNFRPAITGDPVVHQHKLIELGLTDPNAL